MASIYVPEIKFVAPTGAGALVTFSTQMGAIYMRNRATVSVYFSFETIPASATDGDGKFLLQPNEPVNIDNCFFLSIGFKTAAGTATVELIAFQRPGGGGIGIQ